MGNKTCEITVPTDMKCEEPAKPKVPNYQGLPLFDVRQSEKHRELVNAIVKSNNGNMSKYIPTKWGYGPMGGKKY